MVASWLAAHRGQLPEPLWEKRRVEWTPEVSARAWERTLRERDSAVEGTAVVLVATGTGDHGDELFGLILAEPAGDDPSGWVAEIAALYVAPNRHGRGIGRRLLTAAAGELLDRGFRALQIGVLAANLPARGFYEATGGTRIGEREFDEEGESLLEVVYGWPDISTLAPREH